MRQITGISLSTALIFMLLTAWASPRMNEDLFLGLCLGREVAHGTFLDPNSWSFVLPPQVFVDRAWFSHFLYYLSYTLLGSLGPVSLKAILLGCYAAVIYYRCRSLEVSREISLLALTLGVFALGPFLGLRGENFGVLCFLVLTTILTASPRYGRWRQIGAVIVLAIWSNCHGTWPLGALLIGFRFLLDLLYTFNLLEFPWTERPSDSATRRPSKVYVWFNSNRKEGLSPGPDAGGWLITLVLLIPVLIVANPYGLSNFTVFSYVWGTEKFEEVVAWKDNLPLIHPTATLETVFYGPYSVLPFLALLGFFGLLVLSVRVTASRLQGFSVFRRGPDSSDVFMEAAILFILIPIVFKWRRLIVFAAPGLVPLLALLMQVQLEVFRERFPQSRLLGRSRMATAASIGASVTILAVVVVLFFTPVARSYFPNNPMTALRVNPPLMDRILSYDMVWADASEFFKKNGIKGRVLAGLQMADYLLFHLTDIEVFMDLRAQAAYSLQNFKDFYIIKYTVPGQADKAVQVLDRYNVEFVVFDTIYARAAATALMETRKWGCIYLDHWVIVLTRTNSGPYAQEIRSANLDSLWFKNDRTRIVSQATLSLFMRGEINPDLLDRLKDALNDWPDPELYSLFVMAVTHSQSRLDEASKAYLIAELDRLSKINYMAPMGVRSILESQLRILSILYEDESSNGSAEKADWIRQRQNRVLGLMSELSDKYSLSVRFP